MYRSTFAWFFDGEPAGVCGANECAVDGAGECNWLLSFEAAITVWTPLVSEPLRGIDPSEEVVAEFRE